jgi:23S rRNA (uridine2552-2'-O)-methyltransferase
MAKYKARDAVFKQSKQAGYRSRAAFKLTELLNRLPQVREGAFVVDLGCWPGGWLQVVAERVGPHGLVVGVDTEPVDPVEGNVVLLQLDLTDAKTAEKIAEELGREADAVLCDAAPKLSGVDDVDRAKHDELHRAALAVAERVLRPEGALVLKGFPGPESDAVREALRERYGKVSTVRPKATRTTSKEFYWVVGARGTTKASSKARPRRRKRR